MRWRRRSDRRARGTVVYGPYQPPERPHRQRQPRPRAGTEPRTARSDLGFRRTLSRIFAPLFVLGAALFAVLAWRAGSGGAAPNRGTYIVFAAICAALAVIAVIDLAVVARRMVEQQAADRRQRTERR
ncbi:hypothetical protein ACIQGZ_00185 [Streptomyces sp. NPDC092296]|uniref:hypothetical protein n=1 Tax=Streptomyces sp. NPDC092296 TaxID=3366012 RepID=UPI00382A0B99